MSENSSSLLGKIAVYTEILSKDPQSTVFVSLCEAYRQLGMLDDALEIAEKGTLRLPGFSPGFTALGRVYAQRDDLAAAAQAFERALAIEKDNGLALKGLARVRYRQGYSDKARNLLQRVLAQSPEDPIAKKLLASLGDTNIPPVAKNPVPATVPVSPTIQQGPAEVASCSEANAAPKQEKPASSSAPIPTETVADLYRKQGLHGEAATIYRALLRENPHNEKVRQKLIALKMEMDTAASSVASTPAAETEAPVAEAPIPTIAPISPVQPTTPAQPIPPELPKVELEAVPPARPEQQVASAPEVALDEPVASGNPDPVQELVEAELAQKLPADALVLMQFDRWLNAIDQRRAAHVQ